MTTDWYYADGKDPIGPFPAERMQDMVRAGLIKRETMVWHDGMQGWEPARVHFFEPAAADSFSHPARQGGTNYAARVAQRHQDEGLLNTTDPRAYADASFRADQASRNIGHDGLYTGAPSRSFIEAIKVCFRKYATFKGRASRSEYWWFVLFVTLLGFVGGLAEASMGQDGAIISAVISIATFLPSLSAQVRRLHDTNRSGWWIGAYLLFSIFGGIGIALTTGLTTDFATPEPSGALLGLLALWGIGVLIWAIALFVFMVQRGTRGPNRFG